ncbi:GntR family transcriptional regulator [Streptomyces sparsogenes]|uniref:Transcriptional regulator, GntR family domain or Aspartate aminotransferase n=1 Tax=Streptomyces sparsogenes DSM 40356 TaxID=1331668 RepID=A0A1R1SCC7_9ACTN|nr:Transcriptional regulator, GntR family domain or Aspartate aminotransferase [Streptomyces sparsogenes DSM 40356]
MDRTLAGRQLAAVISSPPGIRLDYRKLARSVRSLGLDGRITLHMRLPAEHELASALGVRRATVTAAYDLLRESGYAHSRRGAGTWTALPDGRSPTSVASMMSGEQAVIDLALAALAPPEDAVAEALAKATARAGTPGPPPRAGVPVNEPGRTGGCCSGGRGHEAAVGSEGSSPARLAHVGGLTSMRC